MFPWIVGSGGDGLEGMLFFDVKVGVGGNRSTFQLEHFGAELTVRFAMVDGVVDDERFRRGGGIFDVKLKFKVVSDRNFLRQ